MNHYQFFLNEVTNGESISVALATGNHNFCEVDNRLTTTIHELDIMADEHEGLDSYLNIDPLCMMATEKYSGLIHGIFGVGRLVPVTEYVAIVQRKTINERFNELGYNFRTYKTSDACRLLRDHFAEVRALLSYDFLPNFNHETNR